MTKPKENTSGADAQLDYQQLAEHMLGSWQDQWRQFAGNKDNPFAQSAFGNYGDWLSTWSNAMNSWTATPDANAPQAPQQATPTKPEETTPHAAATATPPAGNSAAASPVSPAPAAASNARDVLLTELARRVEFLHERVVSLESELERLKAGK